MVLSVIEHFPVLVVAISLLSAFIIFIAVSPASFAESRAASAACSRGQRFYYLPVLSLKLGHWQPLWQPKTGSSLSREKSEKSISISIFL